MRRLIGQRGQACGRFEVAAPERARDVMTDDLQEQCMSRTRMSCISLFTSLKCLPFILACLFSLIGADLFLICAVALTDPPRPCSSVQTRSFTRSCLPSITCTTEGACQCFALAHFPLFTCSLLPGCSRQLLSFPPPHPLFLFHNIHLLFCHCTASRH